MSDAIREFRLRRLTRGLQADQPTSSPTRRYLWRRAGLWVTTEAPYPPPDWDPEAEGVDLDTDMPMLSEAQFRV